MCRFRRRAQVCKSGPHPYTTKTSKTSSSTTSSTFMPVVYFGAVGETLRPMLHAVLSCSDLGDRQLAALLGR
jgi:hypothetical protein